MFILYCGYTIISPFNVLAEEKGAWDQGSKVQTYG